MDTVYTTLIDTIYRALPLPEHVVMSYIGVIGVACSLCLVMGFVVGSDFISAKIKESKSRK